MASLLSTILLVFSILFQNQIHAEDIGQAIDTFNDIINLASAAQPIDEFIKTFYDASLAQKNIEILNKNSSRHFNLLLENFTKLSRMIDYSKQKKNLWDYFCNIAVKYKKALSERDLDSKMLQQKIDELALDNSLSGIRHILTKQNTVKFLMENYKQSAKILRNSCYTKMSYIQLLDSLFAHIQITAAQYYTTKCILSECSSNNSSLLLEEIQIDYKPIVKAFGSIMATASREFWACGAHSIIKLMNLERDYYFVQNVASSDFSHNRVVTGARLVVEGSFIFIQIQEAKVLRYGLIDSSTIQWAPLNKDRLLEYIINGKHTLESVDLTSVARVSTGSVVTGLQLHKNEFTNRIKLLTFSRAYNHKTGELNKIQEDVTQPDDATEEFKIEDNDASNPQKDVAISKGKKYVSFKVVQHKNIEENMIPFIDVQNVESERPTPLSGAGLCLKDQPGYGATLALKLFTLNVEPYINL